MLQGKLHEMSLSPQRWGLGQSTKEVFYLRSSSLSGMLSCLAILSPCKHKEYASYPGLKAQKESVLSKMLWATTFPVAGLPSLRKRWPKCRMSKYLDRNPHLCVPVRTRKWQMMSHSRQALIFNEVAGRVLIAKEKAYVAEREERGGSSTITCQGSSLNI